MDGPRPYRCGTSGSMPFPRSAVTCGTHIRSESGQAWRRIAFTRARLERRPRDRAHRPSHGLRPRSRARPRELGQKLASRGQIRWARAPCARCCARLRDPRPVRRDDNPRVCSEADDVPGRKRTVELRNREVLVDDSPPLEEDHAQELVSFDAEEQRHRARSGRRARARVGATCSGLRSQTSS